MKKKSLPESDDDDSDDESNSSSISSNSSVSSVSDDESGSDSEEEQEETCQKSASSSARKRKADELDEFGLTPAERRAQEMYMGALQGLHSATRARVQTSFAINELNLPAPSDGKKKKKRKKKLDKESKAKKAKLEKLKKKQALLKKKKKEKERLKMKLKNEKKLSKEKGKGGGGGGKASPSIKARDDDLGKLPLDTLKFNQILPLMFLRRRDENGVEVDDGGDNHENANFVRINHPTVLAQPHAGDLISYLIARSRQILQQYSATGMTDLNGSDGKPSNNFVESKEFFGMANFLEMLTQFFDDDVFPEMAKLADIMLNSRELITCITTMLFDFMDKVLQIPNTAAAAATTTTTPAASSSSSSSSSLDSQMLSAAASALIAIFSVNQKLYYYELKRIPDPKDRKFCEFFFGSERFPRFCTQTVELFGSPVYLGVEKHHNPQADQSSAAAAASSPNAASVSSPSTAAAATNKSSSKSSSSSGKHKEHRVREKSKKWKVFEDLWLDVFCREGMIAKNKVDELCNALVSNPRFNLMLAFMKSKITRRQDKAMHVLMRFMKHKDIATIIGKMEDTQTRDMIIRECLVEFSKSFPAYPQLLEILLVLFECPDLQEIVLCVEEFRLLLLEGVNSLASNLHRVCPPDVKNEEEKAIVAELVTLYYRLYGKLAQGGSGFVFANTLLRQFNGMRQRERLLLHLEQLRHHPSLALNESERNDLASLVSAVEDGGSGQTSILEQPKDSNPQPMQYDQAEDEDFAGNWVIVHGSTIVPYERKIDKNDWTRKRGNLPTPFVLLKRNKYLNGTRKKMEEILEENQVCNCVYRPSKPGCNTDTCINRSMLIECVPETCPCRQNCHNQRFQKQSYATVEPFKTRGRGWGLKLAHDLKAGEFVTEYMGEVLDEKEYNIRKKKYMKEKNTYFMALCNDPFLMIDASRKSTLARFLNHSCEANCYTQRWSSMGEIVVGVFAKRDLKKGTELTIDYQMESLNGKCLCGATNCRRFLTEEDKIIDEEDAKNNVNRKDSNDHDEGNNNEEEVHAESNGKSNGANNGQEQPATENNDNNNNNESNNHNDNESNNHNENNSNHQHPPASA